MSDFTGIIGARGGGKTTLLTLVAGLAYCNAFNPKTKHRYGLALSRHHQIHFEEVWGLVKKMYPDAMPDQAPAVYYMPNDLEAIEMDMMHNKLVLWDDLQNVFDARFWDLVPPHLRLFFAQVRHYHSQIFYTCPHWSRCDKDLRLGTGRLFRVTRLGRLMIVPEFSVMPDEKDPAGSNILVRRAKFFPHWVWLPFKPEDEMFPMQWKLARKIAKYVGRMFDSWAIVEVGEHIQRRRGGRILSTGQAAKTEVRSQERREGAKGEAENTSHDDTKSATLPAKNDASDAALFVPAKGGDTDGPPRPRRDRDAKIGGRARRSRNAGTDRGASTGAADQETP